MFIINNAISGFFLVPGNYKNDVSYGMADEIVWNHIIEIEIYQVYINFGI